MFIRSDLFSFALGFFSCLIWLYITIGIFYKRGFVDILITNVHEQKKRKRLRRKQHG